MPTNTITEALGRLRAARERTEQLSLYAHNAPQAEVTS